MLASFESFLDEIDVEAVAEGPAAVAQVALFDQRYQLANAILTRRRDLGLTQKRLASLSGIDQAEISRIEHGEANPTLQTLVSLGRGIQCVLTFVPGTVEEAGPVGRTPRQRVAMLAANGARGLTARTE